MAEVAFRRMVDCEGPLHDAARTRTGLADFGASDYLDGLGKLLAAIDADVDPSPPQRQAIFDSLLPSLVGRLHAEAGWRRHPEWRGAAIARPLIIFGAPRTGTTALQQLLSADPRFQGLEAWLIRTPMPRPDPAAVQDHPLHREAVAAYAARLAARPELRRQHHVAPDDYDECLGVMAQSFVCNAFASRMLLPTYDRWFRDQDQTPVYRRLRDVLRLIGCRDPDRPWLLKNPSHLLHLDALLAVFPDARLVHIHRDPIEAIPSLCSLLAPTQRQLMGERLDLGGMAAREVGLWRDALARAAALEAARPDLILNVYEHELTAAPLELAQRIYDFAGRELTGEVRARLARWAAEHPKGGHGAHRYDAEDYGLTREAIGETFRDYRSRRGFAARDARAPA